VKAVLVSLLFLGAVATAADRDTPLQFQQRVGNRISLDLSFRDHTGRSVVLGEYFRDAGRPVLLVPGYVRCEMLCAALSDGLLRAIQPLRQSAGREFQVLYVSVDPHERDEAALQKKRTWVKRYGRLGCDDGVAYLRGTPENVAQLMHEIGFEYRYDPVTGEYDHPAGFVVVSGNGIITHYQLGVAFSAREVEEALLQSQRGTVGRLLERFLLVCSRNQPIRSPYGEVVMMLLRAMACGVMIGLVLAVKARRKPQ